MDRRILLLIPCNRGVRFGDYMMGGNWRIVYKTLRDYIDSGVVDLASIDSCKPGIVARGEEYRYIWCDTRPYWDRLYSRQEWRLEILRDALVNDLREIAALYTDIVYYVNVKAYRAALEDAIYRLGIRAIAAGPPKMSPLSFRSHRSLEKLRGIIEDIVWGLRDPPSPLR